LWLSSSERFLLEASGDVASVTRCKKNKPQILQYDSRWRKEKAEQCV